MGSVDVWFQLQLQLVLRILHVASLLSVRVRRTLLLLGDTGRLYGLHVRAESNSRNPCLLVSTSCVLTWCFGRFAGSFPVERRVQGVESDMCFYFLYGGVFRSLSDGK